MIHTLGGRVDNQVNLMAQNQIQNIGGFLLQLSGQTHGDICLHERSCGTLGGVDTVAQRLKALRNLHCFFLILVPDGHDHIFILGQTDACAQERLVKGLVEGFCNTQTLTGGFHLRSQADVRAADLLEGEYRHLHRVVICLRLKARLIAQILNLITQNHLGSQRYNRNTGYLTDIGNRTAGTGIYLNDVHLVAHRDKLNIDQTDDM